MTWRRAFVVAVRSCVLTLGLFVLMAEPAAADNCQTPDDCFDTAQTAADSLLGMSFLTAASVALNFVPYIGSIKGIVEALVGEDILTGEPLSDTERVLGIIPFGRLGDLFGPGARTADDIGAPLGVRGRPSSRLAPPRSGRPAPLFPGPGVPPPPPRRTGPPPPLQRTDPPGPLPSQALPWRVREQQREVSRRAVDRAVERGGLRPEVRGRMTRTPGGPLPPPGVGEGIPKSRAGRVLDAIAHVLQRLQGG